MENGKVQLVIDKNSEVSIHRQIVNQVSTMIDSGLLKGGNRLPTERLLSEKYGIARGTVKAAYQELMRIGKIYAVQGSGTYVRDAQPSMAQENMRALLSNAMIIGLHNGVSYDCMVDLMCQEYEKVLHGCSAVRVCWVGVTREVLCVGERLLGNVDNVQLTGYMESEVVANPDLMDGADMIVTTENPYEQLLRVSGYRSDKVMRLSLAINEENIAGIARSVVGQRVLMCDMDSLFMEWVRDMEGLLDPALSVELIRSDDPKLMAAVPRSDLLILPTRDAFMGCETMIALERAFKDTGKPVAYVGFHFDRGSMIQYQSQVLRVWAQNDMRRNIDNARLRANYML